MSDIEAIMVQHAGEHPAQPCFVGDYPCDILTLHAEVVRLRKIEEAARDIADGGWLDVDGETTEEWCHWCDGWPKHNEGCEYIALRAALGEALG